MRDDFRFIHLFLLFGVVTLLISSGFSESSEDTIAPARIDAIAINLPTTPVGPGKPISDRGFWRELRQESSFSKKIEVANKLKDLPIPELPDGLYLEFTQNGNRNHYEKVTFGRRARLTPLVLAECLENKGTYLPALNKLINAFCEERTWVLPAHDKELINFNGTTVTVDLFSSNLAWQLAMTDYLLGEKLDKETRTKLKREVSRRAITPFQDMIRFKRPQDWWIKGTNNWNAVCLSGVTGAALIEVESVHDRAEIVAAAEHYSRYFLSGFTKDGYCSEGLGYWNYGFGMFSAMAENFRIATDDAVDLFALPGAAQPAAFGARIVIIDGETPAFADCHLNAKPSGPLMWLLNRVYAWRDSKYAKLNTGETVRSLFEAMIYQEALQRKVATVGGADISKAMGERTIFEEAGIYISRPTDSGSNALAVAFKAGNNGEHHNHNDVGSYVVVKDGASLLLDPGPEVYTKRTFSKDRYESKLLNSFGHPVPRVDGQLQIKGRKAKGRILKEDFSDTTDTVVIDMSSAYKVPGLRKMTRTFEYGRTSGGVFIVTDHVEFNKPKDFETALISLSRFDTGKNGEVVKVHQRKTAATITIKTSAPYDIHQEPIKENANVEPYRLAIRMKKPVKEATIRMIIR